MVCLNLRGLAGQVLMLVSCLMLLAAEAAMGAGEDMRTADGKPSGFVHVMTFGSKGDGVGQFNYIEDFDFTADGKYLLVTDATNATVQVFDKTTGAYAREFGRKGTKPENLVKPEGVSVAPDGRIFIADFDTGYVKVYGSDFGHLKTFSKYGSEPGENIKSEFTCIYDGKYYMAEAGNHRVSVWDLDGKFLFTYGSLGSDNGQMNAPQACKVNNRGEFVVSDLGNNRIQVFDKEGKFLRTWGKSGYSEGAFQRPAGVSVDKYDNVYVTEISNNRIQVFDRMGKLITQFGKKGDAVGEFGNLHGCIVDKETGWLYIGDTANNRVQVCKPTEQMARKLAGQQ
jgi:DNA-binding beta-propeller fold protein YncE